MSKIATLSHALSLEVNIRYLDWKIIVFKEGHFSLIFQIFCFLSFPEIHTLVLWY